MASPGLCRLRPMLNRCCNMSLRPCCTCSAPERTMSDVALGVGCGVCGGGFAAPANPTSS